MTIGKTIGALSIGKDNWESIIWRKVIRAVKRLQMRIAKAMREGRIGKVKALQWLLTRSYYGKLLSVKRVVTNKGKNTPGVDGVIWNTPKKKMQAVKTLSRRGYKPQPLRRIYIPKKNGKKRPLSIPTMGDRAMQALYALALKPVAETRADPNSYGFREERRCADAIGQCFISLAKSYSPRWIFEGDIEACFDRISHDWLLENIPMDRKILKTWLKAGYIEGGNLYPTKAGTPQGGVISPILANMTLDGLEATVKKVAPYRSKVNVIRYADDFIITGSSRELLEDVIRPVVNDFLQERGINLSQEKTATTKIEDGFDFLGQNLRKRTSKLLIMPSREGVVRFLQQVHKIIKTSLGLKPEELIRRLNPKIRGWANYHRHIVAGRAFSYIDGSIFKRLWNWVKRRHPNKGKGWIKRKYFSKGVRKWSFSTVVKEQGKNRVYELLKMSSIGIVRHVKIKGEANPYDSRFKFYFEKRKQTKFMNSACCYNLA